MHSICTGTPAAWRELSRITPIKMPAAKTWVFSQGKKDFFILNMGHGDGCATHWTIQGVGSLQGSLAEWQEQGLRKQIGWVLITPSNLPRSLAIPMGPCGKPLSSLCVHAKSLQLCLTLCDPMDCSPQGSYVHGILLQEHWDELLWPIPGDLLDPEIKP